MKFSVLMSLYIKENPEYLRQSLQSLAAQTYPAEEIVLILDGKITAELEQVLQNFRQILPLVIVPLETNIGLGKALNYGLTKCSYDWVFRMDTDDICVADRFAKQVAFIQAHPNITLLGGQIAEFDDDIDHIVSYRRVPLLNNDIAKFAAKRCPFNHMTVAYQKQAVLSCGGYEDLQEDYYLWLKLIASGIKTANLADILVYARVGNGMLSRRRGGAQAKAEWRLYKLKSHLELHSRLRGFAIFLLRIIPRLLPVSALAFIYKFTRK